MRTQEQQSIMESGQRLSVRKPLPPGLNQQFFQVHGINFAHATFGVIQTRQKTI
jgi:hypothetical protein